jgi:phosphate uptake regulator
MRANPALIEENLSLFSVVRCIERIADHATNIAEDVCYLVEGEIIRHKDRAEALARQLNRGTRANPRAALQQQPLSRPQAKRF